MSTATGPRIARPSGSSAAGKRQATPDPVRSRTLTRALEPGVLLRAFGVAAVVAGAVIAVLSVGGSGHLQALVRWAVVFMALDLLMSWAFIDRHLHPRRPQAGAVPKIGVVSAPATPAASAPTRPSRR